MKINWWVVFLLVLLVAGQIWSTVNLTINNRDKNEIISGLVYLAVSDEEIKKDVNEIKTLNGAGEFQNYYPEDEVWWYKLQCALTDPGVVHVDLSGTKNTTPFTVDERIYLKDYDDLLLDSRYSVGEWVSGGLINGAILSLPPGTYYHYGNSGLMYVTESDIEAIDYDPVARYYRRVRYVLDHDPDEVIDFSGPVQDIKTINVPENGAVLSFGTGGSGFVVANLYLKDGTNWKTVNGLGPGVYNPVTEQVIAAGNIYHTPLNMTPIPGGEYNAGLHAIMNDGGKLYFKVHYLPDWW